MNDNNALVHSNESIINTVKIIEKAILNGGEPGIAIVIDKEKIVLGVVTDGDIRKAIATNLDFDYPVKKIMSKNPIKVMDHKNINISLRNAIYEMSLRNIKISKIVKVDEDGKYLDIINLHNFYSGLDFQHRSIGIYGMGYVGLTLALKLSETKKYNVIGIDSDENIAFGLRQNIPPFYEVGLQSLLEHSNKENLIEFELNNENAIIDAHIICVGTPINKKMKPNFNYLRVVAKQIGKKLKKNDLVICRSTLPVGTSRNMLIPILEKSSKLNAGKDFSIAFAPERTVEGNALKELETLPQIIGGLTNLCRDYTRFIFQKITPTLIEVDSLEAAEMVKLINNTYRDLTFSFANEISMLCDTYNINSFKLISAANEGYPRSQIRFPSPGVGGPCLTKDPYIYSYHNKSNLFTEIRLGKESRRINSLGPDYVNWQIEKFITAEKIKSKLEIFIIGLAFKGWPETNDLRGSTSLDTAILLKKKGHNIKVYDYVVEKSSIAALGLEPVEFDLGFNNSHVLLVMNNHPKNISINLNKYLKKMNKSRMVFDGYGIFDQNKIMNIKDCYYATLGYFGKKTND